MTHRRAARTQLDKQRYIEYNNNRDPFGKWIENICKMLLAELVLFFLFIPPFNIALWSFAVDDKYWVFDVMQDLPWPFHVDAIYNTQWDLPNPNYREKDINILPVKIG